MRLRSTGGASIFGCESIAPGFRDPSFADIDQLLSCVSVARPRLTKFAIRAALKPWT